MEAVRKCWETVDWASVSEEWALLCISAKCELVVMVGARVEVVLNWR